MNKLAFELVENMNQITLDKIGQMGLNNAKYNSKYFRHGKSIADLVGIEIGALDSAIVIAAGPSIALQDPLKQIKEKSYKGAIICTDSALYYCLKNKVIPDLVVTVDPNFLRVIRWFGQIDLTKDELEEDDYFRRQDMDSSFADEIRVNSEILELLSKYGKKIKIALATCASKPVVERVIASGMEIFWWNPMFDDPDLPESNTLNLMRENRFPAINAGGNVGTACYMIAHAVLEKKSIALTGMDFSYYWDTPYKNTQYYWDAVNLVGEANLDSIFIDIENPYLNKLFYTDPAYYWFKKAFLELAADADCITYNCTEGGILFGENINFAPLSTFLELN